MDTNQQRGNKARDIYENKKYILECGFPRKKENDRDRRIKVYKAQLEVINKQISEHFGEGLVDNWVNHFYDNKTLLSMGPDLLLKYGYCEYCEHYIGVSAVRRKLKKVSVLSSYCVNLDKLTKPKNRCFIYRPNKAYRDIIEKKIEQHFQINPWIYRDSHGNPLMNDEEDEY